MVACIVGLVLLGMSFFCCDRVVGALPLANECRLIVPHKNLGTISYRNSNPARVKPGPAPNANGQSDGTGTVEKSMLQVLDEAAK
jgi:hypothetical protein